MLETSAIRGHLDVVREAALEVEGEARKTTWSFYLDKAANVLHEIMAAPDRGIPEEVLEHAKCVAVVPHMIHD
jgi:lipid-binding SYLF domain-containing protein